MQYMCIQTLKLNVYIKKASLENRPQALTFKLIVFHMCVCVKTKLLRYQEEVYYISFVCLFLKRCCSLPPPLLVFQFHSNKREKEETPNIFVLRLRS